MKRILLLGICITIVSGCAASSALRYPPARYMRDNDTAPMAEPKERWRYSYAVGEAEREQIEGFEKMITLAGVPKMVAGGNEEALNTNNFDEAPDSTWFTNRLGRARMAPAEIARGANRGGGPNMSGPLSVMWVGGDTDAPELIVDDVDGDHYFLIFDTAASPESATAAAMISNRLLHAFGYNVPESHIVRVDRAKLVLSSVAVGTTKYGEERPATSEDLDMLWSRVAEDPRTGLARAVALKEKDGIPVGPFSFHGKRRDDKNDRISHEYRRELRGLRTFCAFLNCTTMVDEQTGDFFVTTDGDRGHIVHYILRTDSTLGTYKKATTQEERDPSKWSPLFSNDVFDTGTVRDAFWAAAILSHLSNDAIAAAVDEAKYSSRAKHDEIIAMLEKRRDGTTGRWFKKLSPLSDFAVAEDASGLTATFDDMAGGNVYRYRLRTERGRWVLQDWVETGKTTSHVPDDVVSRMHAGHLYVLEMQAKQPGDEWWLPPVNLFLKKTGLNEITLMGIARR